MSFDNHACIHLWILASFFLGPLLFHAVPDNSITKIVYLLLIFFSLLYGPYTAAFMNKYRTLDIGFDKSNECVTQVCAILSKTFDS
jgi:hypothetical protein